MKTSSRKYHASRNPRTYGRLQKQGAVSPPSIGDFRRAEYMKQVGKKKRKVVNA